MNQSRRLIKEDPDSVEFNGPVKKDAAWSMPNAVASMITPTASFSLKGQTHGKLWALMVCLALAHRTIRLEKYGATGMYLDAQTTIQDLTQFIEKKPELFGGFAAQAVLSHLTRLVILGDGMGVISKLADSKYAKEMARKYGSFDPLIFAMDYQRNQMAVDNIHKDAIDTRIWTSTLLQNPIETGLAAVWLPSWKYASEATFAQLKIVWEHFDKKTPFSDVLFDDAQDQKIGLTYNQVLGLIRGVKPNEKPETDYSQIKHVMDPVAKAVLKRAEGPKSMAQLPNKATSVAGDMPVAQMRAKMMQSESVLKESPDFISTQHDGQWVWHEGAVAGFANGKYAILAPSTHSDLITLLEGVVPRVNWKECASWGDATNQVKSQIPQGKVASDDENARRLRFMVDDMSNATVVGDFESFAKSCLDIHEILKTTGRRDYFTRNVTSKRYFGGDTVEIRMWTEGRERTRKNGAIAVWKYSWADVPMDSFKMIAKAWHALEQTGEDFADIIFDDAQDSSSRKILKYDDVIALVLGKKKPDETTPKVDVSQIKHVMDPVAKAALKKAEGPKSLSQLPNKAAEVAGDMPVAQMRAKMMQSESTVLKENPDRIRLDRNSDGKVEDWKWHEGGYVGIVNGRFGVYQKGLTHDDLSHTLIKLVAVDWKGLNNLDDVRKYIEAQLDGPDKSTYRGSEYKYLLSDLKDMYVVGNWNAFVASFENVENIVLEGEKFDRVNDLPSRLIRYHQRRDTAKELFGEDTVEIRMWPKGLKESGARGALAVWEYKWSQVSMDAFKMMKLGWEELETTGESFTEITFDDGSNSAWAEKIFQYNDVIALITGKKKPSETQPEVDLSQIKHVMDPVAKAQLKKAEGPKSLSQLPNKAASVAGNIPVAKLHHLMKQSESTRNLCQTIHEMVSVRKPTLREDAPLEQPVTATPPAEASFDLDKAQLLSRLGLVGDKDLPQVQAALKSLKGKKSLTITQYDKLVDVLENLLSIVTGEDTIFTKVRADVGKKKGEFKEAALPQGWHDESTSAKFYTMTDLKELSPEQRKALSDKHNLDLGDSPSVENLWSELGEEGLAAITVQTPQGVYYVITKTTPGRKLENAPGIDRRTMTVKLKDLSQYT